MAVVTPYSATHPLSFSGGGQPAAINARALHNGIFARASIANGDSSGSVYTLARIPSNARITSRSLLIHDALTGVSSASLGFQRGSTAYAAVLISAQSLASAASKNAMLSVSNTNLGKTVWQLCGLSADPGGEFDIILTLNAAASAAGDAILDLEYATRA